MKLSIIIPVFNEINYIEELTHNIKNIFINENVEYIFINDGSNDGSAKWLESYIKKQPEENNKFVNLTKNTGKGNALHQGLKICTGDHILFQDSDLELDVKDSLEMYQIIKKDKTINCVFGSRYLTGKLKSNKNYFNEFVGRINSLFFNILFIQSLSDVHCGAKIVSREVIKKTNLTIKDFGFEIDLASQVAKNDFDIFTYSLIITLGGTSIHSCISKHADLKIARDTESILDKDQLLRFSFISLSILFWFMSTPTISKPFSDEAAK